MRIEQQQVVYVLYGRWPGVCMGCFDRSGPMDLGPLSLQLHGIASMLVLVKQMPVAARKICRTLL